MTLSSLMSILLAIAGAISAVSPGWSHDRSAATASRPSPIPPPPFVSATEIDWPDPPEEVEDEYPMFDSPQLLTLADGRIVLSAWRIGADPPRKRAHWLAFLDAEGAATHHVVVPLDQDELPFKAVPTRDGGFLLYSDHVRLGVQPVVLLRIDADGNRIWRQTFDAPLVADTQRQVAETPDGGFFFVGADQASRRSAFFVRRLDNRGKTLWTRRFGGPGELMLESVVALPDGGAIVSGNGQFHRLSRNGRILWRRKLHALGWMVPSTGRSVIIAGYRFEGPLNDLSSRPQVVRLDDRGRVVWRRQDFPFKTAELWTIVENLVSVSDGGALLLLRHRWSLKGEHPFQTSALARYDPDGTLRWWRTVIGNDPPRRILRSEPARGAAVTSTGQVLIVGGFRVRVVPGEMDEGWLRTMPFD